VCPYLRNSIGGDLNGHVGCTRVGFDGVYGGFGYGSRNQEGEGILNFALAYDLFVTNTLYRKKVSHLVTFSSGQHCSQIFAFGFTSNGVSASKRQGQSGENLKKMPCRRLRREFLRRVLSMKEVIQIACGWG
jgi:hypothetical protein